MKLERIHFKIAMIGLLSLILMLYTPLSHAQTEENGDDLFNKSIDSTMALSPLYLPTFYTNAEEIFSTPPTYKEIDTSMNQIGAYDPLLRTENLYQTLGIFGQAHQAMNFTYEITPGFSLFPKVYPLYIRRQKDLSYYDLKTAYTQIAYNYGLATENELNATHVQNVRDIVNYAINLRGYSNEGYFTNQKNSNIDLDLLLHYEIPSGIYGFMLGYVINYLNLQENGGLLNTADFLAQTAANKQGYNMKLYHASSKWLTQDLQFRQYVNLKTKNHKKNNYWGTFIHTFNFNKERTSFLDPLPDTSIYKHYYHALHLPADSIIDTTKFYTIANTLQWSSFQPFAPNKNSNYFFHLTGGLRWEYTYYRNDNYQQHAFIPFAEIHTRLFSVWDIHGKLYYTLGGYQNNDMMASVLSTWALNREKRHFLGGKINFYHRSPDYLYAYFSNDLYLWRNNLKKQNIINYALFWEREGYKVEFNHFLLNHYVYLNDQFQPIQRERFCNVVQLHLYAPFYYKGFGTTANLYLQYSNSNAISVPLFAGKMNFFYRFPIFKQRAKLQVGVQLMYNTLYYADGYNPILHDFYMQQDTRVGNYLYLDAYIAMQVQRIQFYVKLDHPLSGVMGYQYFTTPDYPMQSRYFSLGINWRFHD